MTTNLLSRESSLQSSNARSSSDRDARLMKLMKSYQADQQVKYLHLQAEVEVLLQQLQTIQLKQQLSTSTLTTKENTKQ